MQIDDIDSLISKYTDGETTVAEEQQLRNFFAQDPLLLPDELKPFCALFRWEQQEHCKQAAKQSVSSTETDVLKKQKRLPNWIVAAVSAVAAVVITMFVVRHNLTKTGDYAIINGECTTNKNMVQHEAEAALNMVSANEGEDFQALSQIGGTTNEE